MWAIYEHKRVAGKVDSVPVDVLKRYEEWKDIIFLSGPRGLRLINGFRDKALRGEWRGHRSSRLNLQYQVIYRVEKKKVFVQVVNGTHPMIIRESGMKGCRRAKRTVAVSVGESVRVLRELQELSQNDLARLTGIPQSTISAIENDRIQLGVERAKVFARALHCHPAVLVFPGWDIERESAA